MKHLANRMPVILPWVAILGFAVSGAAAQSDLLTSGDLRQLGMQRFWKARLPIPAGEQVAGVKLLDDNLYVLTDGNRVYAVHAHTGVLRWSRDVADPDLTVRGPSHSGQFVFFTTPGGVRVFNRRSGEPAGEPRSLRGVVVEVAHDIANINIGRLHGVRLGDVLQVYRATRSGRPEGPAFAQLRITSVRPRKAKGRLVQLKGAERSRSGDLVSGNVVLPLAKVKLPFAASSAAVADDEWIYVGAANQRFYCLNILTGFERWQLMTPRTVSATPVLRGDSLYFAGQNGLVVACTKTHKVRRWTFKTEGPIFADLLVTAENVFIASSDRSLYCLNRLTGRRLWRERFENPLFESAAISAGRIYQDVPQSGLHVLDAETGKQLWRRPDGGQFLMQLGDDAYLWSGQAGGHLIMADAGTGKQKRIVDASMARFIAADRPSQAILLVSASGEMMSLRSKNAPYLKPAQFMAVLEGDRAALAGTAVAAAADKQEPEPALVAGQPRSATVRFLFDNWFISRATGRPAAAGGVKGEESAGEEEAGDDEEETGDDDEDDDEWDDDEEGDDDDDEDDEDEDDDDEDEEDDG